MAVDFRDPEQHVRPIEPAKPTEIAPNANGHRRIVLGALLVCAVGMFLLGAWALLGTVSWLSPDIQSLVGVALMATAMGDVAAAALLHRIWRRSG